MAAKVAPLLLLVPLSTVPGGCSSSPCHYSVQNGIASQKSQRKGMLASKAKWSNGHLLKKIRFVPRSNGSTRSNGIRDDASDQNKATFGYTRKDVLLIGIGVTVIGVGLKSGLEYAGVDPLQAGNVVQLLVVLGLTVGWISTYIFRVSNKEMTYAQQLRDYENKVMQKRLESLSEAELEVLLEQVEEEKRRLADGEQVSN